MMFTAKKKWRNERKASTQLVIFRTDDINQWHCRFSWDIFLELVFQKKNYFSTLSTNFPIPKTANQRTEMKLAAFNRKNNVKHLKQSQARDTKFPREQEDFITLSSEEIVVRVTEKLSWEFSRTESGL